jgi:hypothetical protein
MSMHPGLTPDDKPYRILVTGWRSWPVDLRWFVEEKLREHTSARSSYNRSTVLVHGDCPVGDGGVDGIAKRYVNGRYGYMVTAEAHPADFSGRGPKAGPERNARMVAVGANTCLAFPGPNSSGTWDCIRKAADAGIHVDIYSLQYARGVRRP